MDPQWAHDDLLSFVEARLSEQEAHGLREAERARTQGISGDDARAATLLLREAAFDRTLIKAYRDEDHAPGGGCRDECQWAALGWVIRLRAERFSLHPDYDRKWMPEPMREPVVKS